MKSGIGALVKGLESGKDVLLALEELKLGEWKAVRLLHSRSGRRLLGGRRQLGRIGGLLLAQRFEPYAVQQLCKLIADGKGDLQLKAITTLLTVVGLIGGESKGRGKKVEGRARPLTEPTPEDLALVELMARAKAKEREEARGV